MMMQRMFFRKPYWFIFPLSFLLFLIITTQVFANTVHISDQANVLNTNQIQGAASNLNYPVNIYTTNAFNGTEQTFDGQADAKITATSLIVVAIDTVHRYLRIAGETQVPLQSYQYNDAISAFRTEFNTGAGYTNATIAALQSLQNSLASANGNVSTPTSANGGLAWLPYLPICCIGLFILVALALFGIVRGRRRRFKRNAPMQPVNPRTPINPIDPMYNQSQYPPYNQGPYYGLGYPGGYNQGGIGSLGAGGLGAVGGGLIGYEPGKEASEQNAQGDQDYGNFDNNNGGNGIGAGASGDFGNGGGGNDFGGGASANFGNGGGDTGGSGSF